MAWARIDDGFHDHRKIIDLLEEECGDAAIGLWLLCLTWAHRHTVKRPPDERGVIPHSLPRRLVGQGWRQRTDLLEKHHLWELVDGGWRIHDFQQYLPNDDLRNKRRAAARARWDKVPGRESKDAGTPCKVHDEGCKPDAHVQCTCNAQTGTGIGSASSEGEGEVTVRRPAKKTPAPRGTRIPDDFAVTMAMVAWARRECPQINGKLETEKFVNHWTAKAGAGAVKVDWERTWRNWMLNARDRYGSNGSGPQQPDQDPDFWR